MPESNYSRSRESRRRQNAIASAAITVAAGVLLSLTLTGPARFAIVVLLVAAIGFFAIVWARAPKPATLTPVNRGARPGSWPASAPAMLFPTLSTRGPNASSNTELLGSLTFTTDGIVWQPSAQTARSFGVGSLTWGPEWTASARRLRGAPGMVELSLASADETATLWMRRAGSLQIP